MRSSSHNELDYLSGQADDKNFVREMSRRLDALRRMDQHYTHADWRPRRTATTRRARPK